MLDPRSTTFSVHSSQLFRPANTKHPLCIIWNLPHPKWADRIPIFSAMAICMPGSSYAGSGAKLAKWGTLEPIETRVSFMNVIKDHKIEGEPREERHEFGSVWEGRPRVYARPFDLIPQEQLDRPSYGAVCIHHDSPSNPKRSSVHAGNVVPCAAAIPVCMLPARGTTEEDRWIIVVIVGCEGVASYTIKMRQYTDMRDLR
jgi:hypothetical protein